MLALFAFTALGNPDDDAPDAAAALWQRARVAGADSPDMAVDTPALPLDSLVPAVIATDTVGDDSLLVVPALPTASQSRVRYVKTDLDAPVDFSSSDSMVIIRRDSAFMFGNGAVQYGDIKLDAAEIQMDLNDNTVFAVGRLDTTGEVIGRPVFNDKGTGYEASTMRYNFKSEKGYITNVVTQQ